MRIRTLVLTGLLVPGLAFASARGQEHGQQQQDQMGQQQPGQQQPGQQQEIDRQAQQQIFQSQERWDLQGTVTQVDEQQMKLTLRRENLPDAELRLTEQTQIQVDGQRGQLQDIQPGTEVRAQFQLAEDQPVAVEVEAHGQGTQRQPGQQQPGQQQPGHQQQR